MNTTIICFLLLLSLNKTCDGNLSDRLCKSNERIIISFKTANKSKIVSLCADTSGRYLVYRYGTKDHIELQFPLKPDASSWKKFHYKGEWRFGGKANAGFGDLKINFTNIDTRYTIFERWNDEEGSKESGLEMNRHIRKQRAL